MLGKALTTLNPGLNPLFGAIHNGSALFIYQLFTAVVLTYMGLGLYRLNEFARRVTIGFLILSEAQCLIWAFSERSRSDGQILLLQHRYCFVLHGALGRRDLVSAFSACAFFARWALIGFSGVGDWGTDAAEGDGAADAVLDVGLFVCLYRPGEYQHREAQDAGRFGF